MTIELPKPTMYFGHSTALPVYGADEVQSIVAAAVNEHIRKLIAVEPRCWKPNLDLLCKLGSIAVHAQELMSPAGHEFDAAALRWLLADPAVVAWLTAMDREALLPKKRSGGTP